jgi:aldose 1-epimerase
LQYSPTGNQYTIRYGDQEAVVVQLGGGLRAYRQAGRPILSSYPESEMPPAAHGALLAPWPNRIANGRYRFKGQTYQLPVNEPDKGNAIHGLVRWTPFSLVELRRSSVTLSNRIYPQPGYPFLLDLTVVYDVSADGLTVSVTATNHSGNTCPFGFGQHPYFAIGPAGVDACMLKIPANDYLLTDPNTLLPTRWEPVGSDYDFRDYREIGPLVLDTCYGNLARSADGNVYIGMRGPYHKELKLWMGDSFDFVQIFTADTLPAGQKRTVLAIEPMTCPPNAFNQGDEAYVLKPGEIMEMKWGILL